MSIHKSQGSEFPVVILPLTNQSRRMLQRNLIYTAITRSKSKLILLGEYTAFDFATRNTGTARKTYLIERFSDGIPQGRDSSSHSPVHLEEPIKKTEPQREPVSIENHSDPPASPTSQQGYRLTEDNYLSIDPMIGLTEEEIQQFFKN